MRVWVTRTHPEAETTAARLREFGHQPLVAPVLEVRQLDGDLDLEGIGALAFTSRNAVAAFAARNPERGLPVYAVGDATAEACRAHRFTEVASAGGDVLALAALIAARHDPARGAVLHPAAAEPARDLAGELGVRGIAARRHPLYETVPLPLHDAACAALAAEPVEIDAVLVHSPRAARRLAELLAAAPAAAGLIAACISEAAAAPLRQAGQVTDIRVAAAPDEPALLALLAPGTGQDGATEAERPFRLGWVFWLLLLFGAACVLGGGAIGLFGPKLFPSNRPAAAAPQAATR